MATVYTDTQTHAGHTPRRSVAYSLSRLPLLSLQGHTCSHIYTRHTTRLLQDKPGATVKKACLYRITSRTDYTLDTGHWCLCDSFTAPQASVTS